VTERAERQREGERKKAGELEKVWRTILGGGKEGKRDEGAGGRGVGRVKSGEARAENAEYGKVRGEKSRRVRG
jgi:hypothetical protein